MVIQQVLSWSCGGSAPTRRTGSTCGSSNKPVSAPENPRLRVAAIRFLNPAPLLFHFEHAPEADELRTRYDVHSTSPAQCAEQLHTGQADLGLVPIGALPHSPHLLAVPGCTIASLRSVRSIQLVLKPGSSLTSIRTVAADTASRSSVAYVQILLRAFYGSDPVFEAEPADLSAMLQAHDAALLIGDPALLALEDRNRRGHFKDHTWIDLAELWHAHTGLPWVAAVWAVDPVALLRTGRSATELVHDLTASRDAGTSHVETLVREWQPRIAIPAETIRIYLTQNIHYKLDERCLAAIGRFYDLAAQTGALPAYKLPLLHTP